MLNHTGDKINVEEVCSNLTQAQRDNLLSSYNATIVEHPQLAGWEPEYIAVIKRGLR